MKIVLTIHALFGGGAERQAAELANFLVAAGFQVTVITWAQTATDQYQVDARVQRIGLNVLRNSRNLFEAILANRERIRHLRRQWATATPDLVISFTDKMNIVTLASRPNAPVIIAERSDPRKQKLSRLWEMWRDRTYPLAAAIIALTEPIANALRTRFPKNRVLVIPNAIAVPSSIAIATTARQHASSSSRKWRAVAVGRLSAEKGFDLLLRAWKRAAANEPNWELAIVGEGPLRPQLESLITELQLQERVQLMGWCSEIGSQYERSDLYISSSHYEAMSRSLLEALSYQLPVISTRATDGLEELVQDDHNGWLVPPGNIDALANALSSAFNQTELLRLYGQHSALLVQRHAWELIGSKWLDLIRSVRK
jgi:glycosyltransferase involved in cell wall biosynthesis